MSVELIADAISLSVYLDAAGQVSPADTIGRFNKTDSRPMLIAMLPGSQDESVSARIKMTTNWVGRTRWGIIGGRFFEVYFLSRVN